MWQLREVGSAMMRSLAVVAMLAMLGAAAGTFFGSTSNVVFRLMGPERIERIDDGFAITLPRGWEFLPGETYAEGWFQLDDGDTREQHAQYVAEGGLLQARTSWSFVEHEQCDVYDLTEFALEPPAWETLSDARLDMEAWGLGADAAAVEMTYLQLPAGRVLCVDTIEGAEGWDWRSYFYTDGTSWFELVCGSPAPPPDRWQSIADSFEFLLEAETEAQTPSEDEPILEA